MGLSSPKPCSSCPNPRLYKTASNGYIPLPDAEAQKQWDEAGKPSKERDAKCESALAEVLNAMAKCADNVKLAAGEVRPAGWTRESVRAGGARVSVLLTG